MSKRGQRSRRTDNVLNEINEGVQRLAENSDKTKEIMENDKNHKPKLGMIVTIVTLLAALVTIGGFTIKDLIVNISEKTKEPMQQYKIYLSSEYTKLKVSSETDITAVLNFDTDAISITGYLNSVKDGDTLDMIRKNDTEWHKKVVFQNEGVYKVVATATAPNGDVIEGFIEIEVVSVGIK